ncbi:MAG: hypothetical protein HZC51_06255 [Nitrospirae bacterium]|nr:hypothetical protein [Nitrospirota bacterium]
MMRTNICAMVLLAFMCFGIAGCYTHINERHTYIGKNKANGDLSLFRVTIDGYADTSEVKYVAGWRNAEAMDEVYKDEKASLGDKNEKNYDIIRTAQTELVKSLTNQYRNMASKPDPDSKSKAKELKAMLVEAMGLLRDIKAKQTTESPNAPAEKFMLVFSSNPDNVFAEIEQVTSRQKNEGTLLSAFNAFTISSNPEKYRTSILWSQVEKTSTALSIKKSFETLKTDMELKSKELTESRQGFTNRSGIALEKAADAERLKSEYELAKQEARVKPILS